MIRFLPDSWRDAVLRPFAMAAPDGGVYVEIMAPDFRFAFILLLIPVLTLLVVLRPWRNPSFKPVAILLTATAMAFVPWMLTTGNGRYFIPFLLVAGPLCLGLVYLLPTTRAFRLAIATCLVAIQATAIYETNPFRLWDWARWQDAPYFQTHPARRHGERASHLCHPVQHLVLGDCAAVSRRIALDQSLERTHRHRKDAGGSPYPSHS